MSTSSDKKSLEVNTADLSMIEGIPSAKSSNRSTKAELVRLTRRDHEEYDISYDARGSPGASRESVASVEDPLNTARIESNKLNQGVLELSDVFEKLKSEGEGNPPKVVLVSFKVNSISDIDVSNCTFSVNMNLFYHYEDESLIGLPVGSQLDKEALSFYPDIIVINDYNIVERVISIEVVNTYTGAVKISVHMKGKVFLLSLDLTMFPFEAQNLSINLRCRKKDFRLCVLEYFSEESTCDQHPNHGFLFHGYTALKYTTLPRFSTTGKSYSTLHVVVLCQRSPTWFLNNIIFPQCVLVMLSWLAYALASNELAVIGNGYTISVGSLLTSFLVKLSTKHALPSLVNHRTLLDMYVDCSLAFIVFTVSSLVLLDHYSSSSEYLVYILFAINAVGFLIYNIWFYCSVRGYASDVREWAGIADAVNNVYDIDPTATGQSIGAFTRVDKTNKSLKDSASIRRGSDSIDASTIMGLDINTNNISLYRSMGMTSNKSRLLSQHKFGGDQNLYYEDDEEYDEEDGEELVSISNLDASESTKSSSKTLSPKSSKRKKLARDYAANLARVHQLRETRPETSKRLLKFGCSADYAKPQAELIVEKIRRDTLHPQVGMDDETNRTQTRVSEDTIMANSSNNSTVSGSSVNILRRASTKKDATLAFKAANSVLSD
jgi:hypothetical protein